MAVYVPTLQEQLEDAVMFCRQQRHHADCRCNSWRDQDGAGYCNPQESTWTRAISKCLDRLMGNLV